MAYVLIQFAEEQGGTLAVVHNTWITPRKNEVYWPPHKDQRVFDKSLLNGEPVDSNKWKLYNIKRIFGAYDDFEKARQKGKIAEDTSDLQSEAESVITKKRRITRPIRYDNSGSSDDEARGINESRLARPPKITKRISGKRHNNLRTGSCDNKESDQSHSDECHFEYEENLASSSLNETLLSLPQQERLSSAATQEALDLLNTRKTLRTPATPTSSLTSRSTTSRAGTPDDDTNSRIIPYLSTVIEQNKEILAILRTKSTGLQYPTVQAPSDLPAKLPLESFDDLELFDGYLEEKQNEQLMSIFLSTLDRTALVSSTTAILRHCISYKLAKQLSFLGTRQNKKAFQQYNLKKLVVNAVKRAIPSAVERNIEDQIKNWLKRAPRNYQLDQERQQKQNPTNGV